MILLNHIYTTIHYRTQWKSYGFFFLIIHVQFGNVIIIANQTIYTRLFSFSTSMDKTLNHSLVNCLWFYCQETYLWIFAWYKIAKRLCMLTFKLIHSLVDTILIRPIYSSFWELSLYIYAWEFKVKNDYFASLFKYL